MVWMEKLITLILCELAYGGRPPVVRTDPFCGQVWPLSVNSQEAK